MCHKCANVILALLILVFSFWKTNFSMWVIIVSAGIIFLWEIYMILGSGCHGKCDSNFFEHKTGSELMMEKSRPIKSKPSREEVAEVLKRKK